MGADRDVAPAAAAVNMASPDNPAVEANRPPVLAGSHRRGLALSGIGVNPLHLPCVPAVFIHLDLPALSPTENIGEHNLVPERKGAGLMRPAEDAVTLIKTNLVADRITG